MLLKCDTQYVSKFAKLSSGHRIGKVQFLFQSQRRAMLKNVQSTAQLHWFHMPARSCSKSFKLGLSNWTELRLQQYMNQELPAVMAGFRKGRGTRDQIANIHWTIGKATEFQKNICFIQFSCSVVSDSLRPHGLQHSMPPCPSPTPGVYSNWCPLNQWCNPTISSFVGPFSSHLQSFPASGSFPISQSA